jgi:hypothetical protein
LERSTTAIALFAPPSARYRVEPLIVPRKERRPTTETEATVARLLMSRRSMTTTSVPPVPPFGVMPMR